MSNNIFRDTMLEDLRLSSAYPGLEGKLRKWAKPPSNSETEKCERTERMVREAINGSLALKDKDTSIFAKGSFKNRTNVPSDSDVDVGVRLNTIFLNDYPEGTTDSDFNFVDASYTYSQFKEDVVKALKDKFPSGTVTLGDKSIKIKSNTARVDADVVVFAVHRRYSRDKSYKEGVALKSSKKLIYNWPDQNYSNGVKKNSDTGKRYKALVRILKNIKEPMKDNGHSSPNNVGSFLIECLAWNVPEFCYVEKSYKTMTFKCLDYLICAISKFEDAKEWGEVNELKYLFRSSQPWNAIDALQFLKDAKVYLESLENER